MSWLFRAQDHGGGCGVSAGFSLLEGWAPPYPETTGYIIPTFYDYANLTGREEFRTRACRMADWEIEIQLPAGAVLGGYHRVGERNSRPAVFDTGQVILGWCRAFVETKDERYLQAAIRAGSWLVSIQGADGAWDLASPAVKSTVHAYDVRAAWSLLELYSLVDDERYADAARANVEWTLAQHRENGWCDNNAFGVFADWPSLPLTHCIAYVMEGLLEASRILGDERYRKAAINTADRLIEVFERRGCLPGEFDATWNSIETYRCLTGDAQIAGVWLRIYEQNRNQRYLAAGRALNNAVKSTQVLDSRHPGIRGGVKGSQPITGRYAPFAYVSWAAKFLADSLMLEEQLAVASYFVPTWSV